jgi:hypothetical protein
MITVGPNTAPVALTLVPESVIEGRVFRDTDEPVENAQVQVISDQIAGGRRVLQVTGNWSTDDAGEYRIENLTPGKYYVQVMQQAVFGEQLAFNWLNGSAAGGSSREVYPEQFYPNAPDFASAQALSLKPGETAQVNFTLSPKAGIRVSGVLAPAAPNGIFASLQDASGEETQIGIQFDPRTGRWTLPIVPPGAWNLVFRAQNQPGDAYYAEQQIEARGSDIDNVRILLQPLPPIPVHVVNAADTGGQSVQVRLIPQKARLNRQEFGAATDGANPAGPLLIRDVTPGTYTAVVQANGQGCVDSVLSGNVDLTRDPLVVALGSPPQPIQVTLRQDCATLDVTVQSQDHARAVSVILVSDSQAFEPSVTYVGAGSQTQFAPLMPGLYRLYAVFNLNNLEYTNPEALRNLEGQEITLAPNQHASVSVNGAAGGAASQ